MSFKLFVALCALGIPLAQGYSNGAPDSECQSMTPRHHVDPQTTPAPYDFIISKKKIRAGETVELTVKGRGRDDTFKGLLVEARVGETPIGQFNVDQSRQYLQTISCDGGKNVSKIIALPIDRSRFEWTKAKSQMFARSKAFRCFPRNEIV